MDATLKLLAAGALLSIGLAAAFIVPRIGAADTKEERAQAARDEPARVLLGPLILPVGDGAEARAPTPIQLILTVKENGVVRTCALEPRIHDALLVHGAGAGERRRDVAFDYACTAASR